MNSMTAWLRRGLFATVLASLLAPGAALAQSALTPEQLTQRVQRQGATLDKIEGQMQRLVDEIGRLGRLTDNQAMLEMMQLVDDMSREISLLNGQIEQQTFDIAEIKKQQRELYLDVDRRLRELESGAVSQAPAGQISVPQVETTAPATGAGSQVPAAPSTPSAPATPGSQTTASLAPASTVTQSEEKAAYQAAFDTLKEGRYRQAKIELKTFLGKYPNSSYAGNAQYWLGEAHYVTRNFDEGIAEFQKVLSSYPNSNKVPDAMLKLGYTFYELKRFDEAKAVLGELRERFPAATAARLATQRLDRIRKEGH